MCSSLADYVMEGWNVLHKEHKWKSPCKEPDVLKLRMALGNNEVQLNLDETAKLIGVGTRQRVQQIQKDIMESLFREDIGPELYKKFMIKLENIFADAGGFLDRTQLASGLDKACSWQGTTWLSAYCLAQYLDAPIDSADEEFFSWRFETKRKRYDAFKQLLGVRGIDVEAYKYERIADAMSSIGFKNLTYAEYQFMSRKLVDENFIGEDDIIPCWRTMAGVLGLQVADVAAIAVTIASVFNEKKKALTLDELLSYCKKKMPNLELTIGKIRGAIGRQNVGGGEKILGYKRGAKNKGETTFILDSFISDSDKNIAREAVGLIENYLKETGFEVVSVYKTYSDMKSKLSPDFPQFCFYELVRMYSNGRINCQEYPRVVAKDAEYVENAYGREARREFLRMGLRTATLQQLKDFLINSLHESPQLAEYTAPGHGFKRINDSRNAAFVIE